MIDFGWMKIVEGKSRFLSILSSRIMILLGFWFGLWFGVIKIVFSGCKYFFSFREGIDFLGRYVNNV